MTKQLAAIGEGGGVVRYFDAGAFEFLKDLKRNNDRAWFNANKERYEQKVKEPCLEFIADAGPELQKISRNLVADPSPAGGSMFRIHRNVRFSKDKSPTRPTRGRTSSSAGRASTAPAITFTSSLVAASSPAGCGCRSRRSCRRSRERIAARPSEWKKARGTLDHGEDVLKRSPRGIDPDHPMIEDIKRKSFTSSMRLTDQQVVGPDLMKTFLRSCKQITPLMKSLASAVGVRW